MADSLGTVSVCSCLAQDGQGHGVHERSWQRLWGCGTERGSLFAHPELNGDGEHFQPARPAENDRECQPIWSRSAYSAHSNESNDTADEQSSVPPDKDIPP